jgi:hypothetical protein
MRYFFNLAGSVHDPDNEGMELASIADARQAAVKFGAEFLRDRPEVPWLGDEFRIEVTDENQLLLFTLIVLGVDSKSAAGVS